MNDISSRHDTSFIKSYKFNPHSKRASLSISSRREKESTDFNNLSSLKSNLLPYLKIANSNHEGYSVGAYSQKYATRSSITFPDIPYPITPAYALKGCSQSLSPYEQTEIQEFSNIYFISPKDKKASVNFLEKNFGLDDEKGNYKLIIGDHLFYRYEIIDILGKGSFGQVCKCLDHKHKQLCAIKIIKNKRKFHRQAAIEVKILKYLRNYDYDNSANCIHLSENFTFRKHLCLKFEILYNNLYELSQSNGHAGFPLGLIRTFAVQIVKCLHFLKLHGIIHCDLKPENILIVQPQASELKVIDFGSACFTNERMFSYIQSRFYRAPEVILGLSYGCSIDVWSFGCILAELFIGFPLFPGENENEQLLYMMEYLGLPPGEVLAASHRYSDFFDPQGMPLHLTNSKGRVREPGSKRINDKISTSDKKFLNLIESK